MGFTKKFSEDPLKDRVYLLVHSEPKVGKTHMVLDLIRKHGHFVIMLSFDSGTFEVRQNPESFEGKLAIATPSSLQQLRDDMHEGTMLVEQLVQKGVPRANIWICIDTVNALQGKLMIEARKINVKNPDARDSRKEFVRDAVTEVDYNVNLAHMGEVADWLAQVRCNVVINSISKEEYVERKKTGRAIPAITGQSAIRIAGDADAIVCLDRDREGRRWISCDLESGGDRSGRLRPREEADLVQIRDRMLGRVTDSSAASSASGMLPSSSEKNEAPVVLATEAS